MVELQRWSWKSPVQDNVGASAIWKDLKGVATDVHGDVLKQEYLKVTVFDKNSVMTDTFIGEGRAPLRKAGSCLDQDIAIRMRLMDKHNMPVGTAVVTVQVNAHTQKTEENGDQSLSDARQLPKFGFLEFTEISAKNLKNTGTSPLRLKNDNNNIFESMNNNNITTTATLLQSILENKIHMQLYPLARILKSRLTS